MTAINAAIKAAIKTAIKMGGFQKLNYLTPGSRLRRTLCTYFMEELAYVVDNMSNVKQYCLGILAMEGRYSMAIIYNLAFNRNGFDSAAVP